MAKKAWATGIVTSAMGLQAPPIPVISFKSLGGRDAAWNDLGLSKWFVVVQAVNHALMAGGRVWINERPGSLEDEFCFENGDGCFASDTTLLGAARLYMEDIDDD